MSILHFLLLVTKKMFEAAISFVFGGSFVCDTQEHAKSVSICWLLI